MSRIDTLKQKIDMLYRAQHAESTDWAKYLHQHHVFVVADWAGVLAERFGASKDLAMAAGMLHDVADAVMDRMDPRHEEESARIAKTSLAESGFSEEEIHTVVDDAIRYHGCHEGMAPATLEGKVMATADALVHLQTDFYDFAYKRLSEDGMPNEKIKEWATRKIERDFKKKILFDEVREEARSDYERLKARFDALR